MFKYADPVDGLSPRLLRGLSDNGGLVIGALDAAGTVCGFVYGFSAADAEGSYHYSQAAVVAAASQGNGLGRRLKQEQARRAAKQGHLAMRWAYDPLQVLNGHFNLDVLGAWGRWFKANYYDDNCSDRVVVQWDLPGTGVHTGGRRGPAEPRARTAAAEFPAHHPGISNWGGTLQGTSGEWLILPRSFSALEQHEPARALEIRARGTNLLRERFASGLALRRCVLLSSESAGYLFGTPPREGTAP